MGDAMTNFRGKQLLASAALAAMAAGVPAAVAKTGDPVPVGGGLSIDPILDARIRYEHVGQPDTPARADADAVTARIRSGFELKHESGLSFLAESEATVAMHDHYNDTNAGNGAEPFSVVADPENIELNRLQLQYKSKPLTLTLGRQRINLDDQRWVGSVGWRQNEQTFDAVRVESAIGPVTIDASYSISQRTIFGIDADQRQAMGGDFVLLGAGVKAGPVKLKGFGYLLDYDEPIFFASSSQTYGVLASVDIPVTKGLTISLSGSYARQSDYGTNPDRYSADYIWGSASATLYGFGLSSGYEKLGSDRGTSGTLRAVQTPMATLHKFNGWADAFLTTPGAGIQDYWVTIGRKFPKFKPLPGLNASVTYHEFDSDFGDLHYGSEWDAQIGFQIKPFNLLVKYAAFNRDTAGSPGFAFPDTDKFWLQAEIAF